MMSMWAHQLQSQLQTQIETTIQRALAEKLSHTPANSVFEPVRPGGSNHCVVSSHSDQPRRKRTHSGSRSYSPDFKSEEASSHSEVRTGIIVLSEEELLILIMVQKNRNSLMTTELRLMLLLMRSFWKAVKIKKLVMFLVLTISTRKCLG